MSSWRASSTMAASHGYSQPSSPRPAVISSSSSLHACTVPRDSGGVDGALWRPPSPLPPSPFGINLGHGRGGGFHTAMPDTSLEHAESSWSTLWPAPQSGAGHNSYSGVSARAAALESAMSARSALPESLDVGAAPAAASADRAAGPLCNPNSPMAASRGICSGEYKQGPPLGSTGSSANAGGPLLRPASPMADFRDSATRISSHASTLVDWRGLKDNVSEHVPDSSRLRSPMLDAWDSSSSEIAAALAGSETARRLAGGDRRQEALCPPRSPERLHPSVPSSSIGSPMSMTFGSVASFPATSRPVAISTNLRAAEGGLRRALASSSLASSSCILDKANSSGTVGVNPMDGCTQSTSTLAGHTQSPAKSTSRYSMLRICENLPRNLSSAASERARRARSTFV